MKTKWIVMILLVSSIALASASGAGGEEAATGPVELEFTSWSWLGQPKADLLREIAADFNQEYPNITIKESAIPYPRYLDTMLLRLEAGDAPDIVMTNSNFYFTFLDRGFLQPIDEYVTLDPNQTMPVQETAVKDGKNYGMVLDQYSYALIYNVDIFEKAGITEPPTSPEEFLSVAKQLTDAPNQYGYGVRHTVAETSGWWAEMAYWLMAFDAKWAVEGKPTVDTPEFVQAVEYFKSLYDAEIMPKGVDAATYRRMFWEGKIGMMTDNQSTFRSMSVQNPDIRIKAVANPFAPRPSITHIAAVMLNIPEDAKHPEEAGLFFESFFDNLAFYGLGLPNLVGRKGANEEIITKFPYLRVFADTPLGYNGGTLPEGLETRQSEFAQIIMAKIDEVLVRDLDVKEAMAEAQAELEAAFGIE